LRLKLGVPADFKQYHLERKHFDFIVSNCRSGSMKSNPREMSDGEVIQLLEKML
jgi:alcohol dehydrogenase class IV